MTDFDHEELDLIRQANEANLSNASLGNNPPSYAFLLITPVK